MTTKADVVEWLETDPALRLTTPGIEDMVTIKDKIRVTSKISIEGPIIIITFNSGHVGYDEIVRHPFVLPERGKMVHPE
jgi:hypothetical protein